jgi:uncharacterized membrane protein (DUF485 family)
MNLYLISKIIVFLCFYFTFLTLCWKARMRSSWESLKNAFPFVIFESILPNNLLQVLLLGLSGLWFYISLLNPIDDFQNYRSWCAYTFVVQCKQQFVVVLTILFFSLMIIFKFPLFISFAKNKIFLPNSKPTNNLWKIKSK